MLAALLGLAFSLGLLVVVIAGMWKTFEKAGQPGWACIVPVYNVIVFTKISGRPLWWVLLMLIPFLGIIFSIIVTIDFAKNFGKGAGFAMGLIFLGFIFFPILGFGDAEYNPVVGEAIGVPVAAR